MDKESATPFGASSNAIKATADLKEVNREPIDGLEKHINEKKTPDVVEMLKGLVDLLEQMEEKVDHRLQKMEEKVDVLISSVSLNNELVAASMKTGTVKAAEADNMSVDEPSSDDDDDDDEEEPVQRNYKANTKKATTTSFGRGYGPLLVLMLVALFPVVVVAVVVSVASVEAFWWWRKKRPGSVTQLQRLRSGVVSL